MPPAAPGFAFLDARGLTSDDVGVVLHRDSAASDFSVAVTFDCMGPELGVMGVALTPAVADALGARLIRFAALAAQRGQCPE